MATITTLKAGNWSDPTVWNGGVLPGVNDYASAGHAVVIDQNITVLGLRVTAAITGFTVSGSTNRTISLTASDAISYVANTSIVLNITNTATTTILTNFVSGGNVSFRYVVCASNGGTININVLGNWYQSGGNINYPIEITTGSLNQTINITGNILSSANNGNTIVLGGSNNTVNYTGDVTTSTTSTTNPTLNLGGTNCTFNYTGNLTTLNQPFINISTSTITISLNGIINGGTTANNTVLSTGTPIFKVSGIINSYNNVNPIFVKKIRIDSALDTTWTYNTDVVGVNKTLYTSGTAQGQPAINNVRSGTVYGANSEYTGTLTMAIPANVRKGVPTDATIGIADLTAQEFWNKLTSELTTIGSIGKLLTDNVDAQISSRATDSGVINELNTSNTDVAVRMRNVSTVGITGEQIAGQQ